MINDYHNTNYRTANIQKKENHESLNENHDSISELSTGTSIMKVIVLDGNSLTKNLI